MILRQFLVRLILFFDVIDRYSVKNYETISPDFVEYVNNIVDDIPKNYPIVINIISKNLKDEEKSIIEYTILDEYAYDLGRIEKELKELNKNFIQQLKDHFLKLIKKVDQNLQRILMKQ